MINVNTKQGGPEPVEPSAPAPDALAPADESPSTGVEGAVTIALLIISALVLWESFRIGVGELSRPGPGFMSAICAAGMIVTLTAVLVGVTLRRSREKETTSHDDHENQRLSFRKWLTGPSSQVVLIFGIMAGYTALIPLIGYTVTTVLAAAALLLLQGWRGWKVAVASLCIAAASAGVFVFLLGAPLPRLFGLA